MDARAVSWLRATTTADQEHGCRGEGKNCKKQSFRINCLRRDVPDPLPDRNSAGFFMLGFTMCSPGHTNLNRPQRV